MKSENILIRDIMTRGVVTVHTDAPIKQVVNTLTNYNNTGVAVIGCNGVAMGIISGMDILNVMGKEGWENIKAENIMASNIETIKPTSTLREAADIMRIKHVHQLLILSEKGVGISQRPVGILSTNDIVREALQD
jgi:CBS domain-containing protein